MIEHQVFKSRRCALQSLAWVFGIAMMLPAEAQVLNLQLNYVNRIGAGYNESTQTYDPDFIKSNITEPKHRPVHADVCSALESVKIKMTSTEDGVRCKDETVQTLPNGVSSIVLTLSGPSPMPNKRVELKQFVVSSETYRGIGRCKPTKLVQRATECGNTFEVPLASGIAVGAEPQHSFTAEMRAGDRILKTQSKAIAVPSRVPLIVSIGESLASGEGNPDIRGRSRRRVLDPTSQRDCFDDTTVMINFEKKPDMMKQANWYDDRDHRSLRSGPALAARKLLDRWPYIMFLTFAKSGATVADIVGQLGKVKAAVGDHKIDALLISAGGNDVGFSDVLKGMAGDFIDRGAERAMSQFNRKLLILRNEEYPKLSKAIGDLNLNVSKVLINEYPGKLFNRTDGQPARGCGVFKTLLFWSVKKRDAVAMNTMGDLLNDDVKSLAKNNGWNLVQGISNQFATHGYCSSRSFYRAAEQSCDMQGDFQGTMHPNEEGTEVYARALERELRKVLPEPAERPEVEQ
ncbi:hypothetical protein [Bradyrhizobium sp. sBnM-33]|uniref:hypothetical protein n=1 Tax=Bradyrhizobium sp. sBnM-33 TaxID=2831780 RepID=UPI001BCBA46A|nr:hypothetical protein [Bradyrhizobium sp. sBnM-33]WOH47620.1 hypothetical protein RX328_26000 [Bradyrhizobium sp. sBnM-33]